jgi:MoaA/NifB/PqqE/SkfB family radical SAM enzyme
MLSKQTIKRYFFSTPKEAGMNKSDQITEAQIFLTRKCNLRCGYCKLVKEMDELGLEDWKKAYDNMENIGIRTVKLLGGEPTVKDWLPDLIEYSSDSRIKTALLSNSFFSEDMMEKLVGADLWGYFASVDSLGGAMPDDDEKSGRGYAMLRKLKGRIPLLAANLVISRKNFREIPETVRRLSDEGFFVNLCTVQHTRRNDREFSKADISMDYRFVQENRQELEELAERLLMMKRSGSRITVPESYIEGIPVHGIECDWKCEDISQLRIDADGGMMLCSEYRTRLADRYNITSMTTRKYGEFLHEWKETRQLTGCDGCYWSCFLQAEDNIRNNRTEFHYFEG